MLSAVRQSQAAFQSVCSGRNRAQEVSCECPGRLRADRPTAPRLLRYWPPVAQPCVQPPPSELVRMCWERSLHAACVLAAARLPAWEQFPPLFQEILIRPLPCGPLPSLWEGAFWACDSWSSLYVQDREHPPHPWLLPEILLAGSLVSRQCLYQ